MRRRLDQLHQWVNSHERFVAWGTYFLVASVLLISVLQTPVDEYGQFDGRKYVALASEAAVAPSLFMCGNFEHAYWSPGWVVTAAVLLQWTDGWIPSIRLFLLVCALASSILVYRWSRHYCSPAVALLGGILSIASTLVFRLVIFYHYEVFLGLLILVFAWLVVGYSSQNHLKNAGAMLLSGVVLGWASLVAAKVILLAFFFPVAALMDSGKKRVMFFPLMIGGILLVLVPWWNRNADCYGEWIPFTTNSGINLYIANNPDADTRGYHFPEGQPGLPEAPAYASKVWRDAAVKYMVEHPGQTLGRMAIRMAKFFNPHYGDQVPLILLFFIALYRAARADRVLRTPAFVFMLFVPASFLLTHTVFHYEYRFILPVWPTMAWIAAVGISGWKPSTRTDRVHPHLA